MRAWRAGLLLVGLFLTVFDGALASPGDMLEVRPAWSRVIMGRAIGEVGLEIADLDGDGLPEIIATAAVADFAESRYWYVLSKQADQYEMRWGSPQYLADITCLRVFDITQDGHPDILVGEGGRIHIYDGPSLNLVATWDTGASAIYGLTLADVDADGQLDLLFCDSNALYIYDAQTGIRKYQGIGYGGKDVAVGNVDADADLEIVIGGSPGYVLNGRTRAVKWIYYSGFGFFVYTNDIDGDGVDEVIGASGDRITTFDIDLRSPKYEIELTSSLNAIRVLDLEGDGPVEIIYSSKSDNDVHVCDSATGVEKWKLVNPAQDLTNFAVGDTDGDGVSEFVWGVGANSTGADYLRIYDSATQVLKWQSQDLVGPCYALDVGDVDADGQSELLLGYYKSESEYSGGRWFVHDGHTKTLKYASVASNFDSLGLWRLRHANVDADPQAELIVTSSQNLDGILICYDGLTHTEQWRTNVASDQAFHGLTTADIDNDGRLEVVASTTRDSNTHARICFFDAATGISKGRISEMATGLGDLDLLRVANVDADANLEVLAAEYEGRLRVYDGVTHARQLQSADFNITALDTADLDGDGIAEIIIGTSAGAIQTLDLATGTLDPPFGNYGGRIDGLLVRDVAAGPGPDLIYGLDGEVFIRTLYGRLLWRSGYLGANAGQYDSLLLADVDDDGNPELLVNMGHGVQIYQIIRPIPHPGDANCDGVVDFFDVDCFLVALLDGEAAWRACGGDCDYYDRNDLDDNGIVDYADLDQFVLCLLAGCS